MKRFDALTALGSGDAAKLASIMELESAPSGEWAEQDLPAMLRHQMAAPLDFDLSALQLSGRAARDREQTLTQATQSVIRTFDDLLFHPAPPLGLLSLSKQFFKARTQACKKNSADWKLAYLFYLLTLLAARERASKLTALSPKDLLKGTDWALDQVWIDQRTRRVVWAARSALTAPE